MKKNRYYISGNQKGFSLLEAMIVIAIIVIMAAIGIPTFSHMVPDMRLRSAAQDLYSNLQSAKMDAIKTNGTSNLTFDPDNGTYTKVNGNIVNLEEAYKGSVEYGQPGESDTVDFTPVDDQATFNARGMATNTGKVFLKNAKDNSYQIEVLGSGVITLKKWNGSAYE